MLALIPALMFKVGAWRDSLPSFDGRAQTYVQPASELLRGESYSGGETFRRPPVYPAFLAAVFAVAGENARAVTLAQHTLGLGTALAAMLAAITMWGSPVAAAAAGLLIGLNPNLTYYEGLIESETLGIFLLSLSALFVVKALHRPGAALKWGPAAGLALSAAGLCRPEMAACMLAPLPFLPGVPDGWRALRRFLAVCLVPLVLWMFRNWFMFGLFTLSPMGAVTSLQTSGPFINWSSSDQSELKKIYAEILEEKGGSHRNVINEAVYRRMLEIHIENALVEGHRLGVETFLSNPLGYLLATRANFAGFLEGLVYVEEGKTSAMLKFLLGNLPVLAAAGLAASMFSPGRGAPAIALYFLCLLMGNCLVEIGIFRRSITAVPALSLLAAYLAALPSALWAARARFNMPCFLSGKPPLRP